MTGQWPSRELIEAEALMGEAITYGYPDAPEYVRAYILLLRQQDRAEIEALKAQLRIANEARENLRNGYPFLFPPVDKQSLK